MPVNHTAAEEIRQVRLFRMEDICPSPENDTLYRPFNPRDPENIALAQSIKAHGVKEPLVLTCDGFILSGHRRYGAAKMAGLREVPARREFICRSDPDFMTHLREYNRQREKTNVERAREEIVSATPEAAYRALKEHRRKEAQIDLETVPLIGTKERLAISPAQMPFLSAVLTVMNNLRRYLPLSVRQIHYQLLNNPPLRHANKPDSVYANNLRCYKALSELTTRARLEGYIHMRAISDETRPISIFDVHETPRPFLRREFNNFLNGYYRDLQQSQPNHIEILGEKNTVQSILKSVASDFCVPLTIGRGYSSIPPRYQMAERYKRSGKEKLILLVLSDLDPDGEEICQSFARSMRDEFGVSQIEAVKVGLTSEQVKLFNLPPSMEAKPTSGQYSKFVAKYGKNAYELEALPPATLQDLLREALDSVMDIDAYNAEIEQEKKDAVELDTLRQKVHALMPELLADESEDTQNEESDLSDFNEATE